MLKAVFLVLALAASLAAQPVSGGGRNRRWDTIGLGPLSRIQPGGDLVGCTANRHVFICNGVGCPSNGGYYYCTATNTWVAGAVGGPPTGPAGGSLTDTYPNPGIAASGVVAATYGSATQSPRVTIGADGRITAAANVTIQGVAPGGAAGGALTGNYPNPTILNALTAGYVPFVSATPGVLTTSANFTFNAATGALDILVLTLGGNPFITAGTGIAMACGSGISCVPTLDTAYAATVATAQALTNKTIDVEGTGNIITTVSYLTIPGFSFKLPTALAPAIVSIEGSNTILDTLEWPEADGDYSAQFAMPLPPDWDAGTVVAAIRWAPAAAATGNVVWQLATTCVAPGEAIDKAYNAVQTVTSAAPAGTEFVDAAIASVTMTGCAPNEEWWLKILRNRTHASDTLNQKPQLNWLQLKVRRTQ